MDPLQPGPPASSSDRLRTPAAGAVLGEHQLLRPIGRGGMGAVWEALHVPTGARRAVKLLARGASPALKERFRREAAAQARVDAHPHVARVHAAGETPEGDCWLAMDLLPGGDLAGRLRQGPLPPLEAARLAAALARGLAHVHARGVLHRDLKPQNVLFDEEGRPRLADFGLARAEGLTRLTETGTLLGTPAYAAPEQLEGASDVGPAADVWGLGALLYHLLAGRAPFRGQGLPQVVHAVLTARPRPPRVLREGIPRALDALCLRCLDKDPARRPASAAALAESLEAIACGEPDPWAPAGPPRALVGAVVAAGLLAVAVGLLLLRRGAGPRPPDFAAPVSTSVTGDQPPAPPAPASATGPARALDPRALAPLACGPLQPALAARLQILPGLTPEARRSFVLTAEIMRIAPELVDGAATGRCGASAEVADRFLRDGHLQLAGFFLRQAALASDRTPAAIAGWGRWLTDRARDADLQAEGLELLRAVADRPGAGWPEARDLLEALLDSLAGSAGRFAYAREARARLRRWEGEPAARPWTAWALLAPTAPREAAEARELEGADVARAVALLEEERRTRGELEPRFLSLLAIGLVDPRAPAPRPDLAAPLLESCLAARDRHVLQHLLGLEAGGRLDPVLPTLLARELGAWAQEGQATKRGWAALLLALWHLRGALPDPAQGQRWLEVAERDEEGALDVWRRLGGRPPVVTPPGGG